MSLDIETRLRNANPLPRDEQLEQLHGQNVTHRLRSDIRTKREGRMTDTTDRRQQASEEQSREEGSRLVPERIGRGRWLRPGLATVAAAALVAVAIATAVLLTRGDADVAGAPSDPLEVAQGFVEAYGNFDADVVASYLADDVLASVHGGLEGLRLELEFWERTGYQLLLNTCEEQPRVGQSPPGVLVRCTYDYHALRSDQIGLKPFTGSFYNLFIDDGTIISEGGTFEFTTNRFSLNLWEPFAAWIADNHPEDGPTMYADWPIQQLEARTEVSIPLWEQRIAEYVEFVNNG